MPASEDIIIVGAGPCGLAAALSLQDIGLDPLIVEKRNVVHSITQYPVYLQFFSTSEMLEIGGYPFTSAADKPSRLEALNYYRTVAQRRSVRIQAYQTIESITGSLAEGFSLQSVDRFGSRSVYSSKRIVIATGYFDNPNMLGIPGEESEKVSHFFREAHPYTGTKVAIIGGRNSAIDAALELERAGAEVTVVYRGPGYSASIKPWVRPIFEGKVDKGLIGIRFGSRIVRIDPHSVEVERPDGSRERLENDFVLALTGFHPNRRFLHSIGVTMEEEGWPTFNPDTMETNVPGVYLAGVVASRREANEIFIESGRFHGDRIAAHIRSGA